MKITGKSSNASREFRPTDAKGRSARRVACLFALTVAVLSTPVQANGPVDSWSGQDKAMHFGMSAPLGMLGASVAEKLGYTGKTERLVVGAALGMMPGLAKEWADRYNPRATASVKDMAFNVLGAMLGAAAVECCTVRALSSRRDRFDGLAVEYRIEF
jgi:putative lipoprotein